MKSVLRVRAVSALVFRAARAALCGAALAVLACAPALAGPTLDSVQLRDGLLCGVTTGLPGFSQPDAKGVWRGFDVDLCRALATAVLGDPDKVGYVPLTSDERFPALRSGRIDVLIQTTTCTFSRDADPGLRCAGVNYYDGQGFMVKKSLGAKRAADLNNARICVTAGTSTIQSLADYFSSHRMKHTPVIGPKTEMTVAAFESGACEALTTDQSALFAYRQMLKRPDEAVILPDIISKEPLGPMVRADDDHWYKVVLWTLNAIISAEEYGITSANVEEMAKGKDPSVLYLLGVKGNIGKLLGLNNDWAYQVVHRVGNYGEIFDRNLGEGSPLKIKRGLNALWSKGGILYAPPLR
jgi:general L-amino acid transport system substrate-binding protein